MKMYEDYLELHPNLIENMVDEEIVEKVYELYDERKGIVDVQQYENELLEATLKHPMI